MQNSAPIQPVAAVRERAPIELWMFNRKLSISRLAKAIGVARHHIQRGVMSPDDESFRPVPLLVRRKIKILTAGEVGLDAWPEATSDNDLAKSFDLSQLDDVSRLQAGIGADDVTTPSATTPAEGGLSRNPAREAQHHGAC